MAASSTSASSIPAGSSVNLTAAIARGDGDASIVSQPSALIRSISDRKITTILKGSLCWGFGFRLQLLWKRIEYCANILEENVSHDAIDTSYSGRFEFLMGPVMAFLDSAGGNTQALQNIGSWHDINSNFVKWNQSLCAIFRNSSTATFLKDGIVFNPRFDAAALAMDRFVARQVLDTCKTLPPSLPALVPLDVDKLNAIDICERVLLSASIPKEILSLQMRSQCGLVHLKNSFARKLNSVFRNRRLRGLKLEQLAKTAAFRQKPRAIVDTELGVDETAETPKADAILESDVDSVLLDDVYIHTNLNEDTGFGNAYRDVWNGAIVAVKRVSCKDFVGGVFGVLQAAQTLQLNNLLPQPPSPSSSSSSSSLLSSSLAGSGSSGSSPFIHSVLVACVHHDIGYLVSPLAPLGSMQEIFLTEPREKHTLEASQKVSIWLDVISGLEFLHAQGIVHGRLKAANVLMFPNYRAKLCDFGVQSYLTRECLYEHKGIDGVRWLAPELVVDEIQSKEQQVAWLATVQAQNEIANNTATSSKSNKGGKKGSSKSFDETACTFTLSSPAGPFGPQFLIDSSVDIYAFGLIVVALELRQKPFHNIELAEGTYPSQFEAV
jgi:hypothetical protein